MRIGIDARSINGNKCGVSSAAESLIRALADVDRKNEYVLYTNILKSRKITDSPNFSERPVSFKRYSLGEHLFFKGMIENDNIDIFHSLHSSFPLRMPKGVKKVLSVMDLFAAKYSWFFEKYGFPLKEAARIYFHCLTGSSIKSADVIIAISQYTKKDIVDTFNAPERKVKVLYLAAAPDPFYMLTFLDKERLVAMFKKREGIEHPYVLFLGNFRKYKNIEGLLRAFAIIKRVLGSSGLKLAVAGNDHKNVGKVALLAAKLGIQDDVKFLGYVKSEDLPLLYAGAQVFVFPSICEGFGIPPLEAMACGVPVVTSNTGSLPEVVGEGALTFDPYDINDMAEKILSVLSETHLRDKIVEYGINRNKCFNWHTTAKGCLDIYEGLVQA